MMKFKISVFLLFFCCSAIASQGYYRFPDIHDNTVVFTAEGDLWINDLSRNHAWRLTTHPAEETQASISNDGKFVAFAANYEGATEVYIIGIKGGIAKRVSFENSSVKIQGWTKNGHILYSTNNRLGAPGNWTLREVDPKTLIGKSIPLADAVEGTIDEEHRNIYFIQFGLQVSADNAKVYRGGAKGELWRYQLDSNVEAVKLTAHHNGSVRQPMINSNKLYFVSDASGNDNLWSMDTDGSNEQQITFYKEWPIRSASLRNNQIIYQLGADLHLLNLNTRKDQVLSINVTSDFPKLREYWLNNPLKYSTSTLLGSHNNKVVITARGRVAIAGQGDSRLVEIATPANSRTRNAILSHDGKWVYAINDASGEMEIWKFAADGSKNRQQLTKNATTLRWNLTLSPNGHWLAHDDMNGDLWLLNTGNGINKKIIKHGSGLSPYSRVSWSSDSKLLATAIRHQKDNRSRIVLYSLLENKKKTLTSNKYNSFSPAFSPNGDWLYFLSDRAFTATPSSPWGDRNLGAKFDRRTEIFSYALKSNANFPFQSSNESLSKENSIKEPNKDTKLVDWKGVSNRLWQVPVASGNYDELSINNEYIYVIDYIDEANTPPELQSIKIQESPKLTAFVKDIDNYQLSNNGDKMFVKLRGGNNSNMFIIDAKGEFPKASSKLKVNSKDWQLLIKPRQEWNQIFHDAWLMHRDYFFDKNMRGLNWTSVEEKYRPLLNRVTDRKELNDVLAQMMGELNALHSQVRGGDFSQIDNKAKVATLGAVLIQDHDSVKIQHMYEFDNELPAQASPLLRPGVNARNGDIILSINGIDISSLVDVNNALRNQAGKKILLVLKRKSHKIKTLVTPASKRENNRYRYNDWVTRNRQKVNDIDNNIGYLHLYAMGANDIAGFAREFYANYDKSGLIIDVRRNRGGNIDSWIIEKLLRRAWMFWQPRTGEANTNMQQTFRGHLVVLADQFTYSDGETFTAGIKALKLAPVIGKKTAGAGVWLRGLNTLSDNGVARVAEFPQFAMDGRWIIEASGVTPTIEIDNLPHSTFNGKDAQLDAAIKYVKTKLKQSPIPTLLPQVIPLNPSIAGDIISN